MCMPGAEECQKRTLETLDLALWMVVSAGAGPMQDQQVLLTSEPPLLALYNNLNFILDLFYAYECLPCMYICACMCSAHKAR